MEQTMRREIRPKPAKRQRDRQMESEAIKAATVARADDERLAAYQGLELQTTSFIRTRRGEIYAAWLLDPLPPQSVRPTWVVLKQSPSDDDFVAQFSVFEADTLLVRVRRDDERRFIVAADWTADLGGQGWSFDGVICPRCGHLLLPATVHGFADANGFIWCACNTHIRADRLLEMNWDPSLP